MRWSGQIFWLLDFEAVESFCLRIEKMEKSLYAVSLLTLNSQLSTDLAFSPPSPPVPQLRDQRLAHGKSYPVTAAQLLPIHTGFLAPIHCFKLAKNCREK